MWRSLGYNNGISTLPSQLIKPAIISIPAIEIAVIKMMPLNCIIPEKNSGNVFYVRFVQNKM